MRNEPYRGAPEWSKVETLAASARIGERAAAHARAYPLREGVLRDPGRAGPAPRRPPGAACASRWRLVGPRRRAGGLRSGRHLGAPPRIAAQHDRARGLVVRARRAGPAARHGPLPRPRASTTSAAAASRPARAPAAPSRASSSYDQAEALLRAARSSRHRVACAPSPAAPTAAWWRWRSASAIRSGSGS